MKLSDHVDHIRELTYRAFDKQFARLGIGATKTMEIEKIPSELHQKREKLDALLQSHIDEVGNYEHAREKALDELTFTLFNRIAAVKVMEAHNLFAPIITKQSEHGDRSFGHKAWLEENPEMRDEDLEGIRNYIKHAFDTLGNDIPLYSRNYPYALLPYVIELNEIIDAFNAVENDTQVEENIWQSDDILGWLYESYNNAKKQAFKDSKAKTEYDKVSLQSQVYTPRWVVQFLVENSLGKLYLEMYPDSEIKDNHKIANTPQTRVRETKPLHEVKLIDPASGSGNFLLYAFDLFYELYIDQIENYGAEYEEDDIPRLIIENNLHGIDLDDRAIQLAQLGLFIKAKRKRRSVGNLHFNVISSDFYLPEYEEVSYIFEDDNKLDSQQKQLIENIWGDLKFAYKFGSLIKIEEKIKVQVEALYDKVQREGADLFSAADIQEYKTFETEFFANLETAVFKYAKKEGNSFMLCKTQDAITFLKLLTTKYDVATANPPYTDSSDFGKELKEFTNKNYGEINKFNSNLYACFIKRCFELISDNGYLAMLHPLTYMYIKSFQDVRSFILNNAYINIQVELGLGGVFANSSVQVDTTMYVLQKTISNQESIFIDLKKYKNHTNKPNIFALVYTNLISKTSDKHLFSIHQSQFKNIKSSPFVYWISDEFRNKFKNELTIGDLHVGEGFKSNDNSKILRFWWEIYNKYKDNNEYYLYTKGGTYNKWYGNNWMVLQWKDAGNNLLGLGASLTNYNYYFKEGITYNKASAKGNSFRLLEKNIIFDSASPSIFSDDTPFEYEYLLGILNSKISQYTLDCLNPTASSQVGDVKRIPFVPFQNTISQNSIIDNVKMNIEIKKFLATFDLLDPYYKQSPLIDNPAIGLIQKVKNHLNLENYLYTLIMINEAIINENVFNIYTLTHKDKSMILEQEGVSIGSLPITKEAKIAYISESIPIKNKSFDSTKQYVELLDEKELSDIEIKDLVDNFVLLYKANNNLEDFCIKLRINPIDVWYLFKQNKVIPKQRMNTISMELLIDIIREILIEDEDGIIPIVQNSGEKVLLDRLQDKFHEKGFSSSDYASFNKILGREINDYINDYFFKELYGYLKLFKLIIGTPFIWHLTSGEHQGFDAYIIIYKWSRDNLFRLKSVYIEHRERSLVNRQSDLVNDNSASAQNEKDLIYKQLIEIKEFKLKIDELLEEGYNPILDSGVGKNIAPLQKKKMLAYDVLNAGQLKKYLAADW